MFDDKFEEFIEVVNVFIVYEIELFNIYINEYFFKGEYVSWKVWF